MLEMLSGQYTFSIFLRQVLWKLESLSVSFCLMRKHSDSDSDMFYFTNSLMYKHYKTNSR